MEIKKAQSLVFDMLDICTTLGEETLSEACAGIYNDIKAAKTLESIVTSARELMVFASEAPWADYDMQDLQDDLDIIFQQLLEESEEL